MLKFSTALLFVVAVSALATAAPLRDNLIKGGVPPVVVNCKPASAGGGGELQALLPKLRSIPGPVTVQITGMCAPPANAPPNTPVLSLDPELDSRNSSNQITWLGQNQNALFVGGKQLTYNYWIPTRLPGAGAGLMVKLSSLGITKGQVGTFKAGGLGECGGKVMELVIDGEPAIRARAPKAASAFGPFSEFCQIDKALSPFSFTSKCKSLAPLVGAVSGNSSVWAHGWWSFDWADSYVNIKNVTSLGGGVFQIDVNSDTPPVYGFKATARFYVSNSMRLLKNPGEYVIDTSSSNDDDAILYLVPPPHFGLHSDVWLTLNQAPLLTQSSSSKVLSGHVFSDFKFQYGQGSAVAFPNGAGVSLQSNTMTMFGGTCVEMHGSRMMSIDNNILGCGCKGISISGGTVSTLTSSGNAITNNNIQKPGRIVRSYNPAISYGGVGTTMTGNKISNCGHAAILGGGNNIVMSANVLTDVVFGSRDAGAIYFGRSWSKLGTSISNNVFTNVVKVEPTFLGSDLITAQYFDDEQSGVSATSSTCNNVESCFLIGGGRHIFIQQSTANNAPLFAHIDNRGMTWQKAYCNSSGEFYQQLQAANYKNPPFSTQYPYMTNVFTAAEQPCHPHGISITSNTCNKQTNCTKFLSESVATIKDWSSTNNVINNNI